MTNESAYQLVRKYINQSFESHRRYIAIKDMAAVKEERDRALGFLATLRTEEPVQPTLLDCCAEVTEQAPLLTSYQLPTPRTMPDYSPELSQKLDQLDKAIDTANGANNYARATALRDRKGKMLRSMGI